MTSHMKGYLISYPTLQYNMMKRELGIDVHVATRVHKLFCVGALVGQLTSPLKTVWALKLEWMAIDNLPVLLVQEWPILPALELPPFLWCPQGRGATPTKETVGANLIYYITHWSCRNRTFVELKPLKENSTKMGPYGLLYQMNYYWEIVHRSISLFFAKYTDVSLHLQSIYFFQEQAH